MLCVTLSRCFRAASSQKLTNAQNTHNSMLLEPSSLRAIYGTDIVYWNMHDNTVHFGGLASKAQSTRSCEEPGT